MHDLCLKLFCVTMKIKLTSCIELKFNNRCTNYKNVVVLLNIDLLYIILKIYVLKSLYSIQPTLTIIQYKTCIK